MHRMLGRIVDDLCSHVQAGDTQQRRDQGVVTQSNALPVNVVFVPRRLTIRSRLTSTDMVVTASHKAKTSRLHRRWQSRSSESLSISMCR